MLDTCKRLEKEGFEVTYLPVEQGRAGRARRRSQAAMTDKTILVSIMLANNEIGTVQPGRGDRRGRQGAGARSSTSTPCRASARCRSTSTQAQVDLVSLSAHKMYGPKGVGALYVRRKPRVRITAQIDGGGHERGMRSGTLNVPGIVGFGKAAELCAAEMASEAKRAAARCASGCARASAGAADRHVSSTARSEHRLPGNLNISFAYVEGEAMMMALKDVAVSSGSACTSASLEPSYVLRALGVGEELAHTSIRFGLGRFNTEEEVDYVDRARGRQGQASCASCRRSTRWCKKASISKSIQWAAH